MMQQKSASLTSHDTQNEFIQIASEMVMKEIIKEIEANGFFHYTHNMEIQEH